MRHPWSDALNSTERLICAIFKTFFNGAFNSSSVKKRKRYSMITMAMAYLNLKREKDLFKDTYLKKSKEHWQ